MIDIRVAISGSHSVGKTTVMNEIKKQFPTFNIVTEIARSCPYPLNEKTTFKSQEWIFREQVRREMEFPINSVIISDRSVYDQLAYVEYAVNNTVSQDEYEKLLCFITTWGLTYDHIFYIPIEFDMVYDVVRSENEQYRREIDENVKTILKNYVGEHRRSTLTGTVEERIKTVKEKLYELSDKEKVVLV